MKRAAEGISRSKFEAYNFATRYDLSEAATDELLQMLSNVGISCGYFLSQAAGQI
jgi:hypothetical protein